MLRLSYTGAARRGSEKELFARINHHGRAVYFPLETPVPQKAALRAREIYRTLATDGWDAVRQRFARQIVWSVFWFDEPMTCTYATLFTVPGFVAATAATPAATRQSVPVAIIEAEPEVLGGLVQGLRANHGFHCVLAAASARALLQRAGVPAAPQLVLYDKNALDLPAADFQEQLQSRWPGAVLLPFAVFHYSDEIFVSMTGMNRGYFLRRRLPAQLLEPLANLWQGQPPARPRVRAHLRSYFQKLMVDDLADATEGGADDVSSALTRREFEILHYLGLGHTDKTMSGILNISVWTVHAHIKNIFKKLGVHTRAEAVMRYRQK